LNIRFIKKYIRSLFTKKAAYLVVSRTNGYFFFCDYASLISPTTYQMAVVGQRILARITSENTPKNLPLQYLAKYIMPKQQKTNINKVIKK